MPTDVLVYSEADVAEKGEWLGTALRSALLEGEVLYAALPCRGVHATPDRIVGYSAPGNTGNRR